MQFRNTDPLTRLHVLYKMGGAWDRRVPRKIPVGSLYVHTAGMYGFRKLSNQSGRRTTLRLLKKWRIIKRAAAGGRLVVKVRRYSGTRLPDISFDL